MSLATGFYLFIRDAWVPIADVQAGVTVALERARSSMDTLGGHHLEQFAAQANRSWQVDYVRDAVDGAVLAYAAQGLAGADLWIYDVAAAQLNALPPTATQGPLSQTNTILVGGVIAMPVLPQSTLTWSLPLRGGVEYTLTGWTDAAATTVLGSLSAGGNLVAAAGTGDRVSTKTFTPGADGTITFTTGSANVTGLRLTEGALLPGIFLPGEGVPCRVVIDDPSRVYDLAQDSEAPWINQAFNIRQVG